MIEKLLGHNYYKEQSSQKITSVLADKINELIEAVNKLEKPDDGSGYNEGDGYHS